ARAVDPRGHPSRARQHPAGPEERRRAERRAGDAMSAVGPKPALAPVAPVAPEAATAPVASPAEDKKLHQAKDAAQKFEAIFLRQMLSGLEKTNKIGQSGGSKTGGSAGGIYGSMMVNSLADSISQSGGVGLADVILRALQGPHPTGAPKK